MTPLLRHLTSLLLCICLLCPLTSCKKSDVTSATKSPQNENILRYDVNAPFTSLNPTEVGNSGSNNTFPLLYSFLFVPNTNGELEPDLATKWTYDRESFTWTIHLRKDALFHNKQPVTSKDVKYSLETYLQNISPSLLSLVDRTCLLSDTVLSIRLKKGDPEFPSKIWDIEIVPHPNEDNIDYRNHPIGSGPFKFQYRNGQDTIALVANHDYYDGQPSLDGIVFNYQPDKEWTWTRLLSGQTDIAQEISPKNYDMIKRYESRYHFHTYTIPHYTILLYNTHDSLFSDPKVRQALTHAIDREYIVRKLLNGYGVVAAGPMGVDPPYHNPEVKPIPYSPQKGLKLLKEAGWSYDQACRCLTREGNYFEFTILICEESQIEKKVAQYIKLCLNNLGINAHLQSLPFNELRRRYHGNNEFQAVITELQGTNWDPEYLTELWCTNLSGESLAGCFEHREVSRLFRQAACAKDHSKQKELFHEIDTLINSLQPGTFLFHKTAMDVMSKRFTFPFLFSLRYAGIYRLRYASLNKN
jgi:peptide/nickel transport system substrate-binding protein